MKRTLLAVLAILSLSVPAYAQQWDQVNGSMQVRSGPSAPLVIIDQTASGQKIISLRANGTEVCYATATAFTCTTGFTFPTTCTGTYTGPVVSATPAVLECVNGTTVGTWAVPSGASTTSNFLNISGTMTPVSAFTRGIWVAITGAGSASQQSRAMTVQYLAGYSGSSATGGHDVSNASAGTNTGAWSSANIGNFGVNGSASGVGAGHNYGLLGTATGSTGQNTGGLFRANAASAGTNFGGAAFANAGAVDVGFYVGANVTVAPVIAADIGLAVDGGANVITGELQTAGNRVNYNLSAYGVGTVYAFTNSAAAIDFGTTDPVIVLDKAGTYQICGQVNLAYNAATVTTETATIKVRRTNNTAADLSPVVVLDLPVSTVLTHTYMIAHLPCVFYTTAAVDDSITLFGNVSAGLGAGTIDATAIGTALTAVRLY